MKCVNNSLVIVLVDRADAETITATVDDFGNSCGLDMVQLLVGKGFDGAATTNGHVSGVSALIAAVASMSKGRMTLLIVQP